MIDSIPAQMLDTKTVVSRRFIVLTVAPVLCCMILVVFACHAMGHMEFTRALPLNPRALSALVCLYRGCYAWSWLAPVVSGLAAVILVCRRRCTIGALAALIGFMVIFTVFWLMFTLLTLYFANQSFLVTPPGRFG